LCSFVVKYFNLQVAQRRNNEYQFNLKEI